MKFVLDKRFKNKISGKFEAYTFEVGILKNGPYKNPKSKSFGFKSFAGGRARKVESKSDKTLREVSKWNRKKTNYLMAPFEDTSDKSGDIKKFLNAFFSYVFGRSTEKRLINTLQAVVRNPILRGDYGPNARSTIRTKGFDRYMIDTGQLFKNILARVRKRRV